jgi:undecaprenyl-phosphate galactose phosphotransferase
MELMHRNVAIVGAGKTGHFVAAKLLLENSYGIRVVGFIDDNIPKGEMITSNLEVLGDVESLRLLKGIFNIEEVIIAIDNIDYSRLLQIIDICNEIRISIKVTSELFSIIPQKLSIEQYFDIPTVNATLTINESLNSFFKRIFDLITAIFGLMLLSPIFLLLAFLIKITSRGPVFYMQERIGYKGVPFKFYKFRSMTGKEEDDTERKSKMIEFMKNRAKTTEGIKIVNESRVTWIGKIIRKTSIDELPQLFNVVKGEMSLVGPRPCLPYEFANYDEWQKRRVSVLPGCTGLWQVSGRSEVSFKDSVVLDLYYINNMSPWLDLQIILKTIPVMILSRGGK